MSVPPGLSEKAPHAPGRADKVSDMASERAETVHPRTGLREGWDDFYNVPLVHQKGIGRLTFAGQTTAVHTVPLANGLTLDFFAKLKPSDELIVTLVGAASPSKNRYPLFQRVSTFRRSMPALMAFADPTIRMDKARGMLLSWFLGGPGYDPLLDVVKAIRRAQGKTGAKHIAFVGGSGGGYAALRASAMLPGSLAYVQDPQAVVARYLPRSVAAYLDTAGPGWSHDQLLEAFPERFDMVRHYRDAAPRNFVYYAQNASDTHHVDDHYVPFKAVHGVTTDSGVSRDESRVFALFDGEVEGHGKMTNPEFQHHLDAALGHWRRWRMKQ